MSLKKAIAFLLGLGVIAVLVAFAFDFYSRLHAFEVEDRIHGTFYPVAAALHDYEYDNNAPASNLEQLIPHYLSKIPTSPLVDAVEYSIINHGKAWQLSLHSNALPQSRIYCCRSTQEFTPDEERRVLLRYHATWTVLKE